LLIGPPGKVRLAFLTSAGRVGYTERTCTAQGCIWADVEYLQGIFLAEPGALSPLTVDAFGNLRILAWRNPGPAVVLTEYYREGAWTPWTVDTLAVPGVPLDLVAGDGNDVHAAYGGPDGSLARAWYPVPMVRWGNASIISSGGSLVDLAWDGSLHAAYSLMGDAGLWTAAHNGTWQKSQVTPPEGTPPGIQALSFQVHEGRPHLAVSSSGDALTYLSQAPGGEWLSSTLPVSGTGPILRLDGDGRALIAFEDSLGRVMLAIQGENTFFPILFK
jgi:hypothetical protein